MDRGPRTNLCQSRWFKRTSFKLGWSVPVFFSSNYKKAYLKPKVQTKIHKNGYFPPANNENKPTQFFCAWLLQWETGASSPQFLTQHAPQLPVKSAVEWSCILTLVPSAGRGRKWCVRWRRVLNCRLTFFRWATTAKTKKSKGIWRLHFVNSVKKNVSSCFIR